MISETPFWATVKSDFPRLMSWEAEFSSPLLIETRVTTVMTASATANAIPRERAFLARMLARISESSVIGQRVRNGFGPRLGLSIPPRHLHLPMAAGHLFAGIGNGRPSPKDARS